MRIQARWALIPALAGLLAGAVPGAAQASQSPATAAPAVGTAAAGVKTVRTLTLITGDKVTVVQGASGVPAVSVQRGPGRTGIGFQLSHEWHGTEHHISVVPSDAQALLADGRLDARLFDVTEQVNAGYDDASTSTFPLIYSSRSGKSATARAAVQQHAARITRTLDVLGGGSFAPAKRDAASFWKFVTGTQGLRGPLRELWLNGRSRVALAESTGIIGAPEVWDSVDANGVHITGKGVTVADLDTGYDPTHPDLKDKAAAGRTMDFTGSGTVVDGHGHGTHTASIIAGTGAASAGKYKGVAPDATLLVGKVCDNDGFCPDDAVINGMTWASEAGAKAVNLSLGSPPYAQTDPLTEAVEKLTAEHGTLFVIAAGNEGAPAADYFGGTVGSPGIADSALTVGSTTKQDALSDFSSRGPRIGDFAVKPDIVAPGSDITAARAAGTTMGDPVGTSYVTASGTSMATPHVTGAVALLAQEHPDWKAADFKSALTSAAKGLPGLTAYDQGTGRLDVARAAVQSVRATSGNISFGKADYPHQSVTRTGTVTYANDGATDVTLHLSVDANGPRGQKAPAGAFALSAGTVTVPAHGTASATLTATVDATMVGAYGGSVVATTDDGATTVRDAFGVYAEPLTHAMSFTVLGLDGKPVGEGTYVNAFDVRTGLQYSVVTDADGTASMQLPESEYDVSANKFDPVAHTSVLFSEPGVHLTADTSLDLDGRTAEQVNLTVDKSQAENEGIFASVTSVSADGRYGTQKFVMGFPGDRIYATPTAQVTSHAFWFLTSQRWTGTIPATRTGPASSYAYNLAVNAKGGIPSTLTRRLSDRSLGRVEETYAGQGGKPLGVRIDTPVPTYGAVAFVDGNEIPVPGKQTRYYTDDAAIVWDRTLGMRAQGTAGFDEIQFADTTRFRPAATYTRLWNQTPLRARSLDALRLEDQLYLTPGLFSSAAANTATYSGEARGTTGSSTLYRNGVKVASLDSLGQLQTAVPYEKATYTLKSSGTRSVGWSTLGSKASATWTFTSQRPGTTAMTQQPLINVRLNGPVNTSGSVAGGRTYVFLVTAERGGKAATTSLGLRISFDDGKTWKTLPVRRAGDLGYVVLSTPKAGGYASIRLTAKDAAGNAVDQTVIRSFPVTRKK
ncbi:S8 family serine peptidase [Streptomyces sp. MI02-7b]|uniref:S8 family serine peptidase n=1 Tax=Streptomyces sp. MI02-7b TaxID=462941 RepID=UPI0029BE7717|nr:S8 family serine peptidase [Streptomyces sp. MI02-7b]MDX3070866.1 S8 family serine peptidase [Streptomyces sp. MI02-7b]